MPATATPTAAAGMADVTEAAAGADDCVSVQVAPVFVYR